MTESEDKCIHSQNKLKVLCFHGYRQNANAFRQKSGSFRKMVHKWTEFTFLTAPHQVISLDNSDKIDENSETSGIINVLNSNLLL